ncbi:putative ATP-dependent RNA helicase [Candidatus Protofrankia californiensis]|uniref:Putative ATP-dependent RNA helicase n=1 Tax=Candidatus Protofrankia californiensis TaxID=1839754 RepID=A0A1C3PGY4_9ACTN|nr:putative ATP-dependent RNA helicase [Candidatus Protofrankia californiensis]
MRIGLWGAASSGKTTYLGALKFAAEQARGPASWKVTSKDPAALSLLSQLAYVLASEREFPESTQANTRLSWSFLGQKQAGPMGRSSQVEFALDLLDVPGKLFQDEWTGNDEDEDDLDFDGVLSEPSRGMSHAAELVEHLVACDGIIYLFDPIREEAEGDSFRHFNQMLDKVVSRTFDNGKLIGNRLSHQLAVCVTKFDDPRVLGRAMTRRELEKLRDTPGQPRITSDIAVRYFEMLCRERPDSSVQHIRDSIVSNFYPDRVRFHATSSIGFYIGANNRFDPADYANVVSDRGRLRIRSRPQPMNVLEPLVTLVGRIRKSRTGVSG